MTKAPYILGLDIGSNSIGWAIVGLGNAAGTPPLLAANARIFPAATDMETSGETSKTATRRNKRGARRQTDRRERRKRKMRHLLREFGWLDTAVAEHSKSILQNPYELRARGLDEKLSLTEFGRALLHLNQRRGFKSNRRTDSGNKDTGVVKEGIRELQIQLDETNSRTLGEYLYKATSGPSVRSRGRYLSRDMIRHEFDVLWTAQKNFHPEELTDERKSSICDTCLFFQRPFDKYADELVGYCAYEKDAKRARLGHRLAHTFRILQEIDNIRVAPAGIESGTLPDGRLTLEQKKILLGNLNEGKDLKISKICKDLELDSTRFRLNFEGKGRDTFKGNSSEKTLAKVFGKQWKTLPEDDKNKRCSQILELDDESLADIARKEWELSDDQIELLFKSPLKPERHGRVSLVAIQKLNAQMMEGKSLTEARVAVYGSNTFSGQRRVYDLLPFPPGTKFDKAGMEKAEAAGMICENNHEPITNPVVRKALYEVRHLVNSIIKKHGRPESIRVELARDTRGSIDERNEKTKENAKRRKDNERRKEHIESVLSQIGVSREVTGGDLLKYRLWEECGGISPYSGRNIDEKALYTGVVQVEHIIPWSRCLDDSFSNKALSFHDENDEKGQQTPHEAYSHDDQRYYDILNRVRRFKSDQAYQKLRRFEQKEIKPLDGDDSWIARKLNDTRYISRQVHSYLKCLYAGNEGVRVQVARGDSTATLRYLWGLDTVLYDLNDIPYEAQKVEKNRDDHRHHAIDAIVIALTAPSTLRQFANRYSYKDKKEDFPLPWPGFRDQVKSVIADALASHRTTRKARGALHDETYMGQPDNSGRYRIRKDIFSLTKSQISKIMDQRIKDLIQEIVRNSGLSFEEAKNKDIQDCLKSNKHQLTLATANANTPPAPIRRVKIYETIGNTIPIMRSGAEAAVKPGGNHHAEFYQWEDANGEIKRDIRMVTMFEAAQRVRNGQSFIVGKHPTQRNAEMTMWLCKNDLVEGEGNDGEIALWRVQVASTTNAEKSPYLIFRKVNGANIKDDTTMCRVTRLDHPLLTNGIKVTMDSMGNINRPGTR